MAVEMATNGPASGPVPVKRVPVVIPPPVLRPQHVYAPVAPLGMLTLGVFSKRQVETDEEREIKKYSYADAEGPGICAAILTFVSLVLVLVTMPLSLCVTVKVVQEYERAVVFRLGRLRTGGAKGPGLFFIMPCVDTYKKVDLRTVSFDVPPQEVLSRDSVTVSVDAVVYYRVSNPTMATNNIEDYSHSTRLLAATTLRNVLGTKNLAEILSEREIISQVMQNALDEATDPWGVKAERVEIKDVRLPVQLQRAMAAEAEAAREARAKVIAAEGEQKASRALREAASVIAESPSALQLRYLQTLNSIAAEHNSTIIFPMPMNIMDHFMGRGSKMDKQA
eukprot:maker-scaffold21_size687808-snap-gene-2.10 protein:Tk09835 transcript:maker-scaffold21_size687808-snap-gene-2.10-mRNA-1 annotation:"hypothetical protein DAPPUDRAFT_45422"